MHNISRQPICQNDGTSLRENYNVEVATASRIYDQHTPAWSKGLAGSVCPKHLRRENGNKPVRAIRTAAHPSSSIATYNCLEQRRKSVFFEAYGRGTSVKHETFVVHSV